MSSHTIAVIGGTGPQGKGLTHRLARSGHDIVLGSRDQARATAAVDALAKGLPPGVGLRGTTNLDAAAEAQVVLLAVPYEGHDALVASLRGATSGKIVISCVNPLGFDKRGAYGLNVSHGSAAESAAALLPDARIVGAFHHLSAVTLASDEPFLEDVLVVGDDQGAKEIVMALARDVTGRDGVDAGPLRLARQLEPLTAVLISVNRRYKAHSGIRITGLGPVD